MLFRSIRVNAIAPGFIITEMTGQLDPKFIEGWSAKIPLKRGGTVKEVAEVALFLVSDNSSYVTGQVIRIDGGMFM